MGRNPWMEQLTVPVEDSKDNCCKDKDGAANYADGQDCRYGRQEVHYAAPEIVWQVAVDA